VKESLGNRSWIVLRSIQDTSHAYVRRTTVLPTPGYHALSSLILLPFRLVRCEVSRRLQRKHEEVSSSSMIEEEDIVYGRRRYKFLRRAESFSYRFWIQAGIVVRIKEKECRAVSLGFKPCELFLSSFTKGVAKAARGLRSWVGV
jgi:hypothetical protein